MLLPAFEYHEPSGIEEACELLATLKEKASPLAGGTDLLVNMKKGIIAPPQILSLSGIKSLKNVNKKKTQWEIGSCVTAGELAKSTQIRHDFAALSQAAANLGSPLIRNLATIGGNVVSARPAADLLPPLIVYGAKVVLHKKGTKRTVDMDNFFKGPGMTVKGADELLSEILLKDPPPYSGAGYVKLGKRRALEISVVNVAAFIALESPDGPIRDARIALGAVAPVPMRAGTAENVLKGEKPGESLFVKAGEAAIKDSRPIDDFRGSAEYRRDMVKEMTKRALIMAFEEARARELRRWR